MLIIMFHHCRARGVATASFALLSLIAAIVLVTLNGPSSRVTKDSMVELLSDKQGNLRYTTQFRKDVQQVGSALMKGLRDSEDLTSNFVRKDEGSIGIRAAQSLGYFQRGHQPLTRRKQVLAENSTDENETECEKLIKEAGDTCDSKGIFHSAAENKLRTAAIVQAQLNKARAYRASLAASQSAAAAQTSAALATSLAENARVAAVAANTSYQSIAAGASPAPDEQALLATAAQQSAAAQHAYSNAQSAAASASAAAQLASSQSIAAEVAAEIADAAFNISEEDLSLDDVILQAKTVQAEADKADAAGRTASDAAARALLMQQIAQTAAEGARSAQTAAGAFLGYQDARAVRSLSPDLLRWLRSADGLAWLDSCSGWQWLATKEGAGWLGAYDGTQWLQTPHGLRRGDGEEGRVM